MARDPFHHWSGVRLPSKPRDDEPDELFADPAEGAAVPRCLTCGAPGNGDRLMTFALLLLPGSLPAGVYRLCGKCHRYANPPQPADPLDVTDAA